MNKYQTYETIGTISWLTMDFCWMSGYMTLAYIVSIISILSTIISIFKFNGKNKSEKRLLIVSFMWVFMNTLWMTGESLSKPWIVTSAKFVFVLSMIMTIITIITARKEKETIDFKRFKV